VLGTFYHPYTQPLQAVGFMGNGVLAQPSPQSAHEVGTGLYVLRCRVYQLAVPTDKQALGRDP